MSEADRKRNTGFDIKDRFLEFGTFAVLDCLCADVERPAAQRAGNRCWMSQCTLTPVCCAVCAGLAATSPCRLRQRLASEVTPAT